MKVLAFTLECAAVAALLGFLASLASVLVWTALRRPIAERSATARAELAFLAAVLPAIVAAAVTTAAALPSLLAVVGWAEDHCLQHTHHPHLCMHLYLQAEQKWLPVN